VPLQCDEPADFRTFRIGLFGLDKLHNVDRTGKHLADALTEGHASAVLAASIFHFGQHTIAEAKQFLRERGIPFLMKIGDVPDFPRGEASCDQN
jgi:hypothetical protein